MSLSIKAAIMAMAEGHRVTHRFFSEKEWMEIKDGKILFEDGFTCTISGFLSSRGNNEWKDGYSIIDK